LWAQVHTVFLPISWLIAIVELVVLVAQTYHLFPKADAKERLPWQWQPLRGVLKSLSASPFTGSVWVLVTQTDKFDPFPICFCYLTTHTSRWPYWYR